MKTDLELKEQALRALCLTRDYVGYETLPAIAGWEWYDSGLALAESMPESEWSRQFYLRINEKKLQMDGLHQCPYDEAVRCEKEKTCNDCESWYVPRRLT